MLDYHVILDLMPAIALLYFTGRLISGGTGNGVSLSGVQQSILLAIGLQRKTLDEVEKELGVPSSQLLAMFVKVVRKVSTAFRAIVEGAVAEEMPARDIVMSGNDNTTGRFVDGETEAEPNTRAPKFQPLAQNLDEELREGGEEVDRDMKEKQRVLIDALPLDQSVCFSFVLLLSTRSSHPNPPSLTCLTLLLFTHGLTSSALSSAVLITNLQSPTHRYEIAHNGANSVSWAEAERQILNNGVGTTDVGRSTVVSVKSSKSAASKRKVEAEKLERGRGSAGDERHERKKKKNRSKE